MKPVMFDRRLFVQEMISVLGAWGLSGCGGSSSAGSTAGGASSPTGGASSPTGGASSPTGGASSPAGGGSSSGNTYYIAETPQGSGSGADATNAAGIGFFNTDTNWSATVRTPGKISPGDTVILTGTFSSPGSSLVFQGGGTAGNVLTLLFAPNAKFSATHWSAGHVIRINSSQYSGFMDYITVDGGSNGLIEATQCGTGLAYPSEGAAGISVSNSSHLTIKNLTIRNLFVRTLGPTTVVAGVGIANYGSNFVYTDFTVDNCTIHDCAIGIDSDFNVGSARFRFTNNTITRVNWGIDIGGRASGATLDDVIVSGNTIGNYDNWDGTDAASWNALHHNGLFLRCQDSPSTGYARGIRVFNNHFLDGYGGHSTAAIYMNGGDMDADLEIYNNRFDALNGGPTNGLITLAIAKGTARVSNNTFIGSPGGYAVATMISGQFGGSQTKTYYVTNNVSKNVMLTYAGTMTAGAVLVQDHNISGGTPAQGHYSYNTINSLGAMDFASWKTAGRDINGRNADPLIDSSGYLQIGSPAIGLGANLSTSFSTDRNGAARPSSGAWDAGMYVAA